MQIAESAHEAIMLLEEERDANILKATEAEERTLEAIDARDAFKKVPSVCAMVHMEREYSDCYDAAFWRR